MKKQDIRTITINSKFKSALLNAEELAFLEEYLIHYNQIKFITTSYIKHKNHVGKPISQVKLECDRNNILPYLTDYLMPVFIKGYWDKFSPNCQIKKII